MINKEIIKIIKEEIEAYDYLNNDQYSKEQENINLLKNPEFQKEFICDSLLNNNTKIKIKNVASAEIGGDWQNEPKDANVLTLEYYLTVLYKYDPLKEPVELSLQFDGKNIGIGKMDDFTAGDNYTAPAGESWFNQFNWSDINVNLTTADGQDIDFIAFNKAPIRIQNLFIREYVADFVQDKTNTDIRTKEMNDKPQNINYC
jgi:hypothetical protein